jgi:hypothetical protein
MIDEELYERAAAELNSDKRNARLWARACALASDDHDEARFLYTNLRVEEMLAARNAPTPQAPADSAHTPDIDASPSADFPVEADSSSHAVERLPADPFDDLRLEPLAAAENTVEVASARAGVDSPSADALSAEDLQNFANDDASRPESVHGDTHLELPDVEIDLDPASVMQMNDAETGSVSAIDDEPAKLPADEVDTAEPDTMQAFDDQPHRPLNEPGWLDEDVRVEREATDFATRQASVETEALAQDLERQASEMSGSDARAVVPAADSTSDTGDGTDVAPAAIGAAAVVAGTAVTGTSDSPAADQVEQSDDAVTDADLEALNTGGSKSFLIYRRDDGNMQAVKLGVSWPALFFTFPWLLSRGLIGTALIYALLWAVLLAALLWTGFAWLDAGALATLSLKLWALGFAALAVIGLLYIPFRYGNTWHARKLERRGFEYQLPVSANNRQQAVDRLRKFVGS